MEVGDVMDVELLSLLSFLGDNGGLRIRPSLFAVTIFRCSSFCLCEGLGSLLSFSLYQRREYKLMVSGSSWGSRMTIVARNCPRKPVY